jgi:hypothetical protein
MSVTEISIDSNGTAPWIDINFGQTRLGSYRVFLSNPPETVIKRIEKGRNDDLAPDRFPVGGDQPPDELKNGWIVTIDGAVAAIPPKSDQTGRYIITFRILQNGRDISGPIECDGNLKNGTAGFLQYIRFI